MKRSKALLLILAILNGVQSQNFSCISGQLTGSLDDAVHYSDLVLRGLVRYEREGEFGTYIVTGSFSTNFALKSDGLLDESWTSIDMVNFDSAQARSMVHSKAMLFFLIRQQNAKLANWCTVSVEALWAAYRHQFQSKLDLIQHIHSIGQEDSKNASQTDLLYPSPCDDISTSGCSEVGSECSVVNKLPHQKTRCTCVTGFHGDGRNCTALTTEAENAYCRECGTLSRCERGVVDSNHQQTIVHCSCNHFKCSESQHSSLPVCGSDGNTYTSICHMRHTVCLTRQPIHLLYPGPCNTDTRPCRGLALPLSTTAGLITCHKSPCPTMHYCDNRTTNYSVCCPVGTEVGSGHTSGDGDGSDYTDVEGSGLSDNEKSDTANYRVV